MPTSSPQRKFSQLPCGISYTCLAQYLHTQSLISRQIYQFRIEIQQRHIYLCNQNWQLVPLLHDSIWYHTACSSAIMIIEIWSAFEPTKEILYLALPNNAWGVYCGYFGIDHVITRPCWTTNPEIILWSLQNHVGGFQILRATNQLRSSQTDVFTNE